MAVILFVLSVVLATVPPTILLILIWWFDRYDREPFWVVALCYAWGASGAVVLALIGSAIASAMLGVSVSGLAAGGLDLAAYEGALRATLVAPLIEEPAKGLPLVLLLWTRHFDNATDGFVYGAACGLGFALTENFLYFMGGIDDAVAWLFMVIVRTGWSAMMHMLASAMLGAALGWARFRGVLRGGIAGFVGLIAAMAAHATWNGLLSFGQLLGASMLVLDLVLLPIELGALFVVFQACLWLESRMIRRELAVEAEHGVLPAAHVDVLGSWWRRRRGDWAGDVDRARYVAAATRLAMRRAQLETAGPGAPLWLHEEVSSARNTIRALIAAR